MGRFWKWMTVLAATLAILGLAAVASVYLASEQIIARRYPLPPSQVRASNSPTAIAFGKHLVRLYGCADCHGSNLQGRFIPDFGMSSRNLTQLSVSFSDADFERAIRKALRLDGTSVAETMPSDSFQYMPDSDAVAIVSYIRSLKPVGPDIPEPSYNLTDRWDILRGTKKTALGWFPLQKLALDLGPRYTRARQMLMSAWANVMAPRWKDSRGHIHRQISL